MAQKQRGTEVVQVELSTPYPEHHNGQLRFVVWVEASLRPVKGMTLMRPDDPKRWEVTEAYMGIVNSMEGVGSHWKVVQ